MQGHPEVIDYLNTLLTGELAARDQCFIHSRMYEDWGFSKLYERLNHDGGGDSSTPTPCCAVSSCSKVRRACVPTISTRAPRCRRCSRPTSSSSAMSAPRWPRASPLRAAQGLRQPRHPQGPVGRHRGRPRLLVGATAWPDRQDGPGELPAIADPDPTSRMRKSPCASRSQGLFMSARQSGAIAFQQRLEEVAGVTTGASRPPAPACRWR